MSNQAYAFTSPFSPHFREVFYSSIPVNWQDLEEGCITCLPCARDTFEPPSAAPIIIDGRPVT